MMHNVDRYTDLHGRSGCRGKDCFDVLFGNFSTEAENDDFEKISSLPMFFFAGSMLVVRGNYDEAFIDPSMWPHELEFLVGEIALFGHSLFPWGPKSGLIL